MNKRIKKKRAKLRRQKMALLRSVQSVAFLSASIGMVMAYQPKSYELQSIPNRDDL